MGNNLFDIAGYNRQVLNSIQFSLEQNGGEISDKDLSILESSEKALEEKLEACAWAIKNFQAEAREKKLLADNFSKKAKADENTAKRISNWVLHCLSSNDLKESKAGPFKVRQQVNGGEVPIVLDDGLEAIDLPKEYQKKTIEPDMEAIRDALVAGKTIEGVRFGIIGTHLRIV